MGLLQYQTQGAMLWHVTAMLSIHVTVPRIIPECNYWEKCDK